MERFRNINPKHLFLKVAEAAAAGVLAFAPIRPASAIQAITEQNTQCPYGSTQARLQKDFLDPWAQSKTIKIGESIRVGGFHDETGQFANDIYPVIIGPVNNFYLLNGEIVTPTLSGHYDLIISTGYRGESPACEGSASFEVQANQ